MKTHTFKSRFAGIYTWLLFAGMAAGAPQQTPTVMLPAGGEEGYRIAGRAFCDLWEKVTSSRPNSIRCADPDDGQLPPGDVVLIGSDSVNAVVHRLILQSKIEGLGIRYGLDDYRILSIADSGRTLLIIAGGCGRSTIYAAYDFFRRRAGVEYFWDGDVMPEGRTISLEGCDILERPRFEYRGLRYFAHRGPHRFHAEQWDLADWQREIDWIVKKRMNFFMLRIGIDDLFQRAFGLPYPPEDGIDPDAAPRSYDDRTSLWPLRYRGELRKRVLAYARDRGLIHPEDTGTITHWYSHTPGSFYEKHPDFPVTRDQKTGYKRASAAVWDIEHERTWEAYWKLTETHIREFGEPRMFHTIGLAERRFGGSEREDLQRKLHAYRKIQEVLRRRYADAPLLIASWDMMGWWKNENVRQLMGEFDPTRTILIDYTADLLDRKTYREWDVLGKFPWIFGIFHAFAADSEMREDYNILRERIGEAASDGQCKGLVLWPEISHSNTLLLEYLAANGWRPDQLDGDAMVRAFCAGRYAPGVAEAMEGAWRAFLAIAATHHWSHAYGGKKAAGIGMQFDPHFRILDTPEYSNLTDERTALHSAEYRRLATALRGAPAITLRLAELADANFANELWRRDAIDIARTIVNRGLKASLMRGCVAMQAWAKGGGDEAPIRAMEVASKGLMRQLADLLELSDDFSLDATLRRMANAPELGGVAPRINPHAELTLKGNSENNYCRAHQYEIVRHVYLAELDEYWKSVGGRLQSGAKKPWVRPASFGTAKKAIQDRFYERPLDEMAPGRDRSARNLKETLGQIGTLIEGLPPAP